MRRRVMRRPVLDWEIIILGRCRRGGQRQSETQQPHVAEQDCFNAVTWCEAAAGVLVLQFGNLC